jgi:hypothetical protein
MTAAALKLLASEQMNQKANRAHDGRRKLARCGRFFLAWCDYDFDIFYLPAGLSIKAGF